MLGVRVADGSRMRLIGKCLHVGVLEGVELPTSETGTAQGSVLSPLLGNVYLHYVLDLWFEQDVKPRLRGRATLIRYADDFIIYFEEEDDAQRVLEVLGKRLERYGLVLHPDKTRLLPFRRPPSGQKSGKGPATFDFLGFTFYWARSRKGRCGGLCKTRSASLRRAIQSVYGWCRRATDIFRLRFSTRRSQGVSRATSTTSASSGNFRSLLLVLEQAKRSWYKWLCRRSQRKRLTWERFEDLLRDFPLPEPRIRVRIWGS